MNLTANMPICSVKQASIRLMDSWLTAYRGGGCMGSER